MSNVRAGGCRCGKVRFEVESAPLLTFACHCRGCQRMSASAYSLSEAYPSETFRLTAGETVLGGLQGETRHYFCGFCKSWLYSQPKGVTARVNVRSTMFDEPRMEPPFVEVFVNEGLPWTRTGAAHSFDTVPPIEDWLKLGEAFAERNSAAALQE